MDMASSPQSDHPFVDPTPGLRDQYDEALRRLEAAATRDVTLRRRVKLWFARRRLWWEYIGKPRRSAHW
jgi:hypothetical protein